MGDKIHDHKLKEKMEARTRSYLTYNQIKHMMVSRREPYALWDDIGSYERYKPRKYAPEPHRRVHKWWGELGVRPWEQEEAPFRNCRGPGMNPWILSTSANAPFATYHNEPMQVTVGGLTHTRPMVIAPWEKREEFPMRSEGKYCGGHLTAEAIKKVQQLPWALWEDGNRHPKEGETTEQAFPHNKRNESPWNMRTKPDIPQPPQRPIILEPASSTAPFGTLHNKVVVKHNHGPGDKSTNKKRLYQREPRYHDGKLDWPFSRDEWVYHSKLPKDPKSFPRDPATFVPFPFHYADEPKKPGHCDLKQGHPITHQFYPGNPAAMPAAGDFGRVEYPLKLHSYPRDPSTYVPFPTHYAYEPAIKNQRHCEVKEGHQSKHQFNLGDPSKMPVAGDILPEPMALMGRAPRLY